MVVARCGLYLKETATEVEGAFRISGSAKRMRDLQEVFDTGPRVCVSYQPPGSWCTARGVLSWPLTERARRSGRVSSHFESINARRRKDTARREPRESRG